LFVSLIEEAEPQIQYFINFFFKTISNVGKVKFSHF